MIIQINYEEGDRVDFVPDRGRLHGPGGAHGAPGVPEGHSLHAFEKARQEASGARKKAVIDAVIKEGDVTKYRLMLDDGDMVWCEAGEIEALDSVSQLGDLVGHGATLKETLANMDAADEGVQCCDCKQMTTTPFWSGRDARCEECRNRKLGLD